MLFVPVPDSINCFRQILRRGRTQSLIAHSLRSPPLDRVSSNQNIVNGVKHHQNTGAEQAVPLALKGGNTYDFTIRKFALQQAHSVFGCTVISFAVTYQLLAKFAIDIFDLNRLGSLL